MNNFQRYTPPETTDKDFVVPGDGMSSPPFRELLQIKGLHWPLSLEWSAALLLFLFAMTLDFYRLGNPSIWFDEAFSIELSRLPLPTVLRIISASEANMALYYIFMHFWLAFTGLFGLHQTEFLVRIPSVLCAALSVVVVFAIGKRFIGIFAGIIVSILYALCSLQLIYAQQARSYSMQMLFVCLSWFALLIALKNKETHPRWWIFWVMTNSLAVYVHLFSLLVFGAQIVGVAGILLLPNVWQASARTHMKALVISILSSCTLMSPMIWLARQGSKTGWMAIPHPHNIYTVFLDIAHKDKIYLLMLLLCFLAGAVIIIGSPLFPHIPTRLREREKQKKSVSMLFEQQEYLPFFWFAMCWIIIPIISSYTISQGATRLFSSRYLVVIVPSFLLLVGLGIKLLHNRGVQILLCCILIYLAYAGVPMYYRSAQVEDWNTASYWVMQHYHDNDALICYNNVQGCQISMEYYFHAYSDSGAHFTSDYPGFFSWYDYGYRDPYARYNDAINPALVDAFAKKHSHLFYIIGRADVSLTTSTQRWLDSHFHYMDQMVTPTVTVRLYTTDLPTSIYNDASSWSRLTSTPRPAIIR